MRIRPTELGLKGLMLLAALEVAFLATSYSNLFFLLIVFCCVLGGLGLLTGMQNLRAVRVLAVEVPPGPAGEPRPLRLLVETRRPVFDVGVTLADAAAQRVALPPVAFVDGHQALTVMLPGQPRGVRQLPELHVTSRFPFGLLELTRRQPLAVELVTYPAPAGTDRARPAAAPAAGRTASAQPASVAGLRPFRTGDSTRDVHWKATARRSTPIVKEREGEAGDASTVVIDRRGDADTLERALAGATAVVLGVAGTGHGVRVVSQDYAVHLPGGQPPGIDVLRWLANAAPLPPDAPAPSLRPQHAGTVHA